LARLSDAAPLLLVRGDVGVLTRPSVAIVGARAATAYGRRVAHTLAGILARRGVVVVSGLARGIDAEAHRGCLEGSGVTVAVQGCGPDRVFPAAHAQLAVRIAERGALVSELPPGSPARKHHFPLRNRLISGLATCVVVVEARDRSGSLLTARHALDQGTDVLAVPGPIDAPTSVGSNRLLRDGAAPVLDVNDVLQSLGLPLVAPVQQTEPQAPFPGSPIARRILDVLADAPASLDELIRRLGRAPAEITGELVRLELEGWVTRERDGRLRLRAPAARAAEPGTPGGPRGPGERGSAR
jgi:DNA processing protein